MIYAGVDTFNGFSTNPTNSYISEEELVEGEVFAYVCLE